MSFFANSFNIELNTKTRRHEVIFVLKASSLCLRAFVFKFFVIASLISLPVLGQELKTKLNFKQLDQSHDIALSPWGPYSKKYAGISHIPDMQSGMRFDVSVVPGYYRNRIMVPNVIFESGYYPWNISADMSRITYRYELEWKDKVYVDVTYTVIDSSTVLADMHCVNRSVIPQVLQLNLMANICYPDIYPSIDAHFPKSVKWINAINYKDLQFARPRPSDNLVYDGWLRGEARNADYLDGSAVAKGFGADKGDKLIYEIEVPENQLNGILTFRYRMPENTQLSFKADNLTNSAITFTGTGQFELLQVPYTAQKSGKQQITLTSNGGAEIELNGLFIGSAEDSKNIRIEATDKAFAPEISSTDTSRNMVLKYRDANTFYGIAWNYPLSVVRKVVNDDLDMFFRKYVHEHVRPVFMGNAQGFYSNVFMRPVELAPMSDTSIQAFICNGTQASVNQKVKQYNYQNLSKNLTTSKATTLPEGAPYEFSRGMLQAAILSNIVYPTYTQHAYIRHFTPGKWWNSLYTWDLGFIALGLAEIDIDKAIQCLNAYTTPENSQSAFIHHGSPVPVQMYAFYDLWNRTQSTDFLRYFYPRMKRYYEFMAGRSGSSTMASQESKILKTWDYFYNSGGWDDYPPQKAVHAQGLESSVSPIITTAHVIRSAKILRKAAQILNIKDDIAIYDKDIKTFSTALQTYAWDEPSGYFGYVRHDSLRKPIGILRYAESGQNYNMGLDGAYPLFSGICTQKQQDTLLDKIFSDKHMWSRAGICVVDKEAAYYRIDGYWNGAVWMPHQWFIWKTMFDLGQPELAYKIAQKALDVWKAETDETFFTYEHFFAKTARGAGWHQFGGLSAPVLSWFSAYFKPGTVSNGFEVWIDKQSFNADTSAYEAQLSFDDATAPHKRSMMVCLNPKFRYKALVNGKETNAKTRFNGLVELELPASNKKCELRIVKI